MQPQVQNTTQHEQRKQYMHTVNLANGFVFRAQLG